MPCLGPIIVSIDDKKLSHREKTILSHDSIGGVILFANNYKNRNQLKDLVQSIKAIKSPELIVCVDQEGGRIQRFQKEFYSLPSLNQLGRIYDSSAEDGLRASYLAAQIMALELLEVNIDFSFTPVVDLDYELSSVIGDRSFHSSSQTVTDLSTAYLKGLEHVGMKAVAKHFPGHGGVDTDSHFDKPIDQRAFKDLSNDLNPFESLFKEQLSAIMTAHILFPMVDSSIVTFSQKWLKHILRDQLNFDGLVISDDLSMEATKAIGPMIERVNMALDAGCDYVLWCHSKENLETELDSVVIKTDSRANKQIELMKPLLKHKETSLSINELTLELDHLLNI